MNHRKGIEIPSGWGVDSRGKVRFFYSYVHMLFMILSGFTLNFMLYEN